MTSQHNSHAQPVQCFCAAQQRQAVKCSWLLQKVQKAVHKAAHTAGCTQLAADKALQLPFISKMLLCS